MRISDWSSDVCSSDLQRPVQPAADLYRAVLVRVVPEGPGVDGVELVNEALAGRDWPLREVWYAVPGVRHPHAVPVHRGLLGERVLHDNPQALALGDPDLRPGDAAVGPDGGVREHRKRVLWGKGGVVRVE